MEQFLTWLHVLDCHDFGTLEDSRQKLINLPLIDYFSYRNVLQNGAKALSKMFFFLIRVLCQKHDNFVHFGQYDLVQILAA